MKGITRKDGRLLRDFDRCRAKGVFAISENAYQLGYRAKRDKTCSISSRFPTARSREHCSGLQSAEIGLFSKSDSGLHNGTPPFFHEAIRKTIEEYNFRYTDCYECKNCDGTEGYWYEHPDGRKYFRCGIELIEIDGILHLPLEELLTLFRNQHDSYLENLQVSQDDDKVI